MAAKRARSKIVAPVPAAPKTGLLAESPRSARRGRIDIDETMRGDVRRFAEIGIPHTIIARIVGISLSTLKRRCRAELDAGVEVANARIALTLFDTAMSGNTTAMLWWEKTRAGRRELAGEAAGVGARLGSGSLDDEQKAAEFRQQLGLTSETKMLAQERAFEQERYQIRHAALEREKAEMDPDHDPVAYAKAVDAIAQLERQHQATLTEIDRKAVLARNQLQLQAINQIASSWGSAIGKMVTLQQGFGATVKSMWQGVQQAIGDAVAKIIENWLAKEITALAVKLGLIKTQSASSIAAEAASAGAGGTASMAAAPFPFNLSAIGFGEAMSAAALSYGTMAALNVGAYDLSSDGIAMLHKGETVIPADQAGGWRNVMGLFASMPNFGAPSLGFGSAANSNAPAAANDSPSAGGSYHYHDHSARGLSEAQIIANRHAFAKAMKMAHREGKLGFSLPG